MKKLKVIGLIILAAIACSFVATCIFRGITYLQEVRISNKVVDLPAVSEIIGSLNPEDIIAHKGDKTGNQAAEVPAYPTSVSVSTSDYSELVAAVMPSIVSIESEYTRTERFFFGFEQEYKGSSSGTGFIITQSPDNIYIATNNHVVEKADKIVVTLFDSVKAEAYIVGTDSDYDLAVISVPKDKLTVETISHIRVAVIGNSDNISVGDFSLAIGNALGYGQSSTVGYISALDRELTMDDINRSFIQTDAAINPGNSGGPLLNIYGEVIGINSAKSAEAAVEGMGYAIPISYAIPIINDLVSYEELNESDFGYIGIEGKDISKSYATGFGMPQGIYVFAIEEDSPASMSDLYVGDIIVGINGRTVTTMAELQNRLEHLHAGAKVILNVKSISGGRYKDREVSIILGYRPQ